jgi:hypothetical protein
LSVVPETSTSKGKKWGKYRARHAGPKIYARIRDKEVLSRENRIQTISASLLGYEKSIQRNFSDDYFEERAVRIYLSG